MYAHVPQTSPWREVSAPPLSHHEFSQHACTHQHFFPRACVVYTYVPVKGPCAKTTHVPQTSAWPLKARSVSASETTKQHARPDHEPMSCNHRCLCLSCSPPCFVKTSRYEYHASLHHRTYLLSNLWHAVPEVRLPLCL